MHTIKFMSFYIGLIFEALKDIFIHYDFSTDISSIVQRNIHHIVFNSHISILPHAPELKIIVFQCLLMFNLVPHSTGGCVHMIQVVVSVQKMCFG